MSEADPPRNNLSWRVAALERDVDRLKEGQPDVIAERVGTLDRLLHDFKREVNDDMSELRKAMNEGQRDVLGELKGVRRIVIGFMSGLILVGVGAVLTIVLAQ